MANKGLITIGAMARECHRLSGFFLQAQEAGLQEVCVFFLGLLKEQAQELDSACLQLDCRQALKEDLGRWAQVFSSQAHHAWEEGQAHHACHSSQARAAILAAREAACQLWELAR